LASVKPVRADVTPKAAPDQVLPLWPNEKASRLPAGGLRHASFRGGQPRIVKLREGKSLVGAFSSEKEQESSFSEEKEAKRLLC
jgi:hypothetical protein